MITEINDKQFYIIFAQFEQRQKEMENSPISLCLYLHKTEHEADPVESEFYLIIDECQKGMQHHEVMNGCPQTVPGLSYGQNIGHAHTMQYVDLEDSVTVQTWEPHSQNPR